MICRGKASLKEIFHSSYLDCNWDACCAVLAVAHLPSVAAAEHFAVDKVLLEDLLIALPRLHIDGALGVDLYLFFRDDDTTGSPMKEQSTKF